MGRTAGLLVLACVLALVGAAALAWVLGAFDAEPAASRPVTAVAIDATPALTALERRAAALQAAEAATATGELDALLAQDPLALDLPELSALGVTARDVVVRRSAETASVEATVDPGQLAALAPDGVSLAYDREASADAGAIVLSGEAEALGFEVPVSVRVAAVDGRVVAVPEGLPIGETVLFDDARVEVTALRAQPAPDGALRVRAEARVVG